MYTYNSQRARRRVEEMFVKLAKSLAEYGCNDTKVVNDYIRFILVKFPVESELETFGGFRLSLSLALALGCVPRLGNSIWYCAWKPDPNFLHVSEEGRAES